MNTNFTMRDITFQVMKDNSIVVDPYTYARFTLPKENVEIMIDGLEDILSMYKNNITVEFEDNSERVHSIMYDGNKFFFDNKAIDKDDLIELHNFLENYFYYYMYQGEEI